MQRPCGPGHAASPRPTRPPVALPNGHFFSAPSYTRGLGSLRITNNSPNDAVANLKRGGPEFRAADSVYIRAHAELTLDSIGPGTFVLQFATGRDWDDEAKGFQRDESTLQFSEPSEFQEVPTLSGATNYWVIHVTLNMVPGDTARTNTIAASEFRRD